MSSLTTGRGRGGRSSQASDDDGGRLSVSISEPLKSFVLAYAAEHGVNGQEAVRRAVRLLRFVEEMEADGGTVLVQRPGQPHPERVYVLY